MSGGKQHPQLFDGGFAGEKTHGLQLFQVLRNFGWAVFHVLTDCADHST